MTEGRKRKTHYFIRTTEDVQVEFMPSTSKFKLSKTFVTARADGQQVIHRSNF